MGTTHGPSLMAKQSWSRRPVGHPQSIIADRDKAGKQQTGMSVSVVASDSSDAAVPAGGKKESDAACHVRLDLSA
jgi:hypothetical protein